MKIKVSGTKRNRTSLKFVILHPLMVSICLDEFIRSQSVEIGILTGSVQETYQSWANHNAASIDSSRYGLIFPNAPFRTRPLGALQRNGPPTEQIDERMIAVLKVNTHMPFLEHIKIR